MPFKKGEVPKGANVFKKGRSGNPKGRPPIIPELNKLLADVLSEQKDGIIAAKSILMSLRNQAIKGDVRAAEVLLNRAYGNKSDFTLTIKKLGKDLEDNETYSE